MDYLFVLRSSLRKKRLKWQGTYRYIPCEGCLRFPLLHPRRIMFSSRHFCFQSSGSLTIYNLHLVLNESARVGMCWGEL